MELQNWLEQEEDSWIKEGKPDGWASGFNKANEVTIGAFRYIINVTYYSSGNKLIQLQQLGGRV